MPIQRRLPKRGFTNIFRKDYAIINLDRLDGLGENAEVTYETLLAKGLICKAKDGVKVLGRGDVKKPLVLKVSKCTESARQKIEASGGRVEVV